MTTAFVTRTKSGKRTAHVGDCPAVTRCLAPIGTRIAFQEMSSEAALQGIEKGTYSDCKACAKTPRGRAALAPTAEEAPEPAKKVKVTVINTHNGNNRIHAAGCKDVTRDARKYGDRDPWTVVVGDVMELALALWSDIAGDTTVVGSPEHRALAKEFLETDDEILPCCAQELMSLAEPARKAPTKVSIVDGRKEYRSGTVSAYAAGRGRYELFIDRKRAGEVQFAGGAWRVFVGGVEKVRGKTMLEAFEGVL